MQAAVARSTISLAIFVIVELSFSECFSLTLLKNLRFDIDLSVGTRETIRHLRWCVNWSYSKVEILRRYS